MHSATAKSITQDTTSFPATATNTSLSQGRTTTSSSSRDDDHYLNKNNTHSRHIISSSTNTNHKYHDGAAPQQEHPFSDIPLATITPQSTREISELTTHSFARRGRQQNTKKATRASHRPGHGMFLLLIILLTITGIVLWSIPRTRRNIGVLIYLPIYAICVFGYILFLCLVGGESRTHCRKEEVEKGQGDEWLNDESSKPWALREYLSRKREQYIIMSRTRKNKKKMERQYKMAANDLKLNTTSRTEDSFQDIQSSNSNDTNFGSGDDEYDVVDTFQDDTHLQPPHNSHENLADMFQMALPKLSHTLEAIEEQIYSFADKIRHSMAPPQQCYECRDGVPSEITHDNILAHHHGHGHNHGHDCGHGHVHGQDMEFQPPQTDAQNYLYPYYPRVDLSGKYKLVHNYNFDAFLKSQNVPLLIRKAANSSKPVHTITHEGNKLRIHVDGITKGDTTYMIDGPPSGSNIRHLKFDDYVTWVDDGQAVQVRKVAKNAPPNGAVELIVKRQLANHGHNLILTSKAIFEDGSESLESVQTFHRIH